MSVTPETQLQNPSIQPQKGPKAAVTHATYPEFSGNMVAISAQTRASGMDQIKGKIAKAAGVGG